ncbi:hypothetical protein [Sulfurimonas sp.]
MLIEKKKFHSNVPFKRRACIAINTFLMKIYDRFRGCSGVKEYTDKRMKEIEENKNKVEFVNANMPIVIDETRKLQDRNKYLEGRVVVMFNEMKIIKKHATNKDYLSIIEMLSKYNLDEELEY